jgi:hypothetical protein
MFDMGAPLRAQMEQLQRSARSMGSSVLKEKRMAPQWQLPSYL